jgi:hypothetical protein
MLGFSPLASAALADDGVVAEQAFGLDAITTGAAADTVYQYST